MNKYTWKIDMWSTQDQEIDANDVGKELEDIETKEGITPRNVVEYAKNEKTTLNKMFEWNDAIAGEKWRIQQARDIIRNISVEYIKQDNTKTQIRAFVKTSLKHKEEYRNIEAVVSDEEQYALLLNQAYKELNSTKNKYVELQEIQELLKDIPEVL